MTEAMKLTQATERKKAVQNLDAKNKLAATALLLKLLNESALAPEIAYVSTGVEIYDYS